MGSRLVSARLIVLGIVIIVTILVVASVASISQEAQPAPSSSTTNTPPTSETQQREKVVPERLLFTVYEAFGKRFQNPMGVFYDNYQDEIFVADTGNHRVVILDGKDGYPKSAFGHRVWRSGESKVSLGEPRSIAVNSLSEIFIVDNLAGYVNVCDFRGDHIMDIRIENYMLMPVDDPAQYANAGLKPVAVTVDSKDNVALRERV